MSATLQKVAIDRFIQKVSRKNEPLEAFTKTQHFATLRDSLSDGIKQQANHIVSLINGKNDPSMLPDNYRELSPLQESNLSEWLKTVFPGIENYVNRDTVYDSLRGAFDFSAKAQYSRWGVMVKADSVAFAVTNPQYLSQLQNQAAYLLLRSSIDETTLNDMISFIAEAKADGLTIDELAAQLADHFDEVSQVRGTVIARTETARAMGDANRATMVENGVATKHWVGAGPADDELCRGNIEDGSIPVDEAFSSGDMNEPAHPNCLLPDQEVKVVRVDAKLSTQYDGPAVRLTFASGKTLSVTPNHLVATRSGWVAASEINHGQDVLSTNDLIEQMATTIDPNIQPIKALIQDVGVSGKMVSRLVPATSVDFHGDESSCQDINIELPNGVLRNGQHPFNIQRVFEGLLSVRDIVYGVILSGLRSFQQFIFSPFRSLDTLLAFSRDDGSKIGVNFVGHYPSGSIVSDGNTSLLKAFSKRHAGNTSKWSEFLDRFAAFITFDKVVNIERFTFHGLVYDLTVPYHFYTANSIITHNCECYTEADEINLDTINIWDGS